jgi:signal peptidase I
MSQQSEWQKFIKQFIFLLFFLCALTVLLSNFVITKDRVNGPSMEPTLLQNDRLFSLQHRRVRRNAIVLLHAPDRPNTMYIKRVVGMPGDTLAVKKDILYVNGHKQAQPYLHSRFVNAALDDYAKASDRSRSSLRFTADFNIKTLSATRTVRVPAGQYFVMGDNRYVSHDSRAFGFVKQSAIQSVVVMRYWPLKRMHMFK